MYMLGPRQELLFELEGYQDKSVHRVQFDPTGSRLVSSSIDRIVISDASTGRSVYTHGLDGEVGLSMSVSPEGTCIAFMEADESGLSLMTSKNRSAQAYESRIAREQMVRLGPVVNRWLEQETDDGQVLNLLEEDLKNRDSKESPTLRALVLKKLVERRQQGGHR